MPTTQKKSALQSTNLWTGIATIVTAVFLYFGATPDLAAADQLTGEASRLVDAIAQKNYGLVLAVVVNAGNILYHLFLKK